MWAGSRIGQLTGRFLTLTKAVILHGLRREKKPSMKPPKSPLLSSPTTVAWWSCPSAVYFLAVGDPHIAIKIGVAAQTRTQDLRSAIKRRMDQIQSSNHVPIELIGLIIFEKQGHAFPMREAEALERNLHNEFQHLARFARDTRGSEWFTYSDELLARIQGLSVPPEQLGQPRFFCNPIPASSVQTPGREFRPILAQPIGAWRRDLEQQCQSGAGQPTQSLAQKPGYLSQLSALEIATCISDAWDSYRPASVLRPTQSGFRVSILNQLTGRAAVRADVTHAGTGSSTADFKKLAVGFGRHDKAVASCQNSSRTP